MSNATPSLAPVPNLAYDGPVLRARDLHKTFRQGQLNVTVLNGASLDEIATSETLSRKRVEKALRDELRKRWIAPAQDHARLQIARLEAIATLLKEKAKEGDLPTIDRLLKVLDRLDRYHGFTSA